MPSFLTLPYLRWRHGKGYGIHSPFAYRFITEVLRLPKLYGYYSYLYIPEGDLRTLFRVAVRLGAQRVAFIGCDKNPLIRKTLFLANPRAAQVDLCEADFIIFDAKRNPKLAAGDIPPTANLVIFNYKKWKARKIYLQTLPNGMVFRNSGSLAIAATLPHLPRQDFDVKF